MPRFSWNFSQGVWDVPLVGELLGSTLTRVAQAIRNLPAMRETWVPSLVREDPPEKGMATHSSILTWRVPGMEEPGGYSPGGSHRVSRR